MIQISTVAREVYSKIYSFGSWNYILYLLVFLVCCLLLICAYIKIRFRFWSAQPVFHIYDFQYYFWKYGIIMNELPEKNCYCNFQNIEFKEINLINNVEKQDALHLIQNHYLSNGENKFEPSRENVFPYFSSHNSPAFFSFYYENEVLTNSMNSETITRKKMVGIMTTRPLHITIFYNKSVLATFDVYYVDYLCVDKTRRKKGVAPQLIQTHDYHQRRANSKIPVSLFKRENELTGIVPLCVYKTLTFDMKKWNKPMNFLNGEISTVECNTTNIQYLIDFLKENENQFHICILPELSHIIELVKTQNIFICFLISNDEIISAYFFRKTCTLFDKNQENLSCFASIKSIDLNTDTFTHGFKIALGKICEKHGEFCYLSVENISHNYLIVDNLLVKNSVFLDNPCAYFFYNFAYPTFNPKNVLILN